MFALSFHMIDLIRSIFAKVTRVSTTSLPMTINTINVNDTHFMWFSMICLIIIAATTAIITSVIQSGTIKEGYKEMILYSAISIVGYKIMMILFDKFFMLFTI